MAQVYPCEQCGEIIKVDEDYVNVGIRLNPPDTSEFMLIAIKSTKSGNKPGGTQIRFWWTMDAGAAI